MEVLVILGLTSAVGYYLNKDAKNPRTIESIRESVPANDLPNNSNIYSSNRYNEVDDYVRTTVDGKWQESLDPVITNTIPPFYNTYGTSGMTQTQIGNIPMTSSNQTDSTINKFTNVNRVSDAAQTDVSVMPMFKSTQFTKNQVPQTFDPKNQIPGTDQTSLLTGLPIQRYHQNMVPFFGATVKQNSSDQGNGILLERYTGANTETRIKKVAPAPLFSPEQQNIYGFEDATNTERDRYNTSNFRNNESPIASIMVGAPIAGTIENLIVPEYKTTEELNVNPKMSYKGRIITGKGETQISTAENLGKFVKRRPNRFLEKDISHYHPNTGPKQQEYNRENFYLKPTDKQDLMTEYSGNATAINNVNKSQPRLINQSDYVSGVNELLTIQPDDKRQTLDAAGNRNLFGGENDFRVNDYGKQNTFIPETERQSLDDFGILNVNKETAGNYVAYTDSAKVTVKQGTVTHDYLGNITSEFNKGSVGAFDSGLTEIQVPATQKQTTILKKYIGSKFKDDGGGYMQANYEAPTTVKQTVLFSSNGNIDSQVKKSSLYDAYKNIQKLRNPAQNKDYMGGATSSFDKPESRTQYLNANISDRKENTLTRDRFAGAQKFDQNISKDQIGELTTRETKNVFSKIDNRDRARTVNYYQTPSKNTIFLDQTMNKKIEQVEQTNQFFDPSIFAAQRSGNECQIDIRKGF
jgi:hypothetical protein